MGSTLERQKEHQDAVSKISPTLQSASLARIPPPKYPNAPQPARVTKVHTAVRLFNPHTSVMAIAFRNPHGSPMALSAKKTGIARRQSHVGCSCHGLFKVLSKYRAAGS
jgi:hypothetical protein